MSLTEPVRTRRARSERQAGADERREHDEVPEDQLVRPSLAFAAMDVLGKVLAFGVVVVLARRLSDAAFGEVVSSLASAAILLAVFDFGMNFHLVALVVRDVHQAHDALARRYQALGGLMLGAAGAMVVPAARPLAACVFAGAAMAALPTGALLAGRARSWAAWSLVGPNVLFLLAVIVLPAYDAPGAIAVWGLANVAVLISLWRGVPWVRPKRRPGISLWKLHRRSLSLAVFNLVVLSYGRIDTVLVAVLVSSAAAGVYGTCYRVVLSTVGLASWSANIAAKRMAAGEEGGAQLRRLLRYSALVAVVVSLGLLVALEPAVRLLLGRPVTLPATALWAMAALPLPLILMNPVTYFVAICGHQRDLAVAALGAGALALVAYPAAIRALGATGAAVGSLAIEVTALVLFARVARRASLGLRASAA